MNRVYMFGFALISCLVPCGARCQQPSPLPRGHLFFQDDFEQDDALAKWSGAGQVVALPDGGHALFIERSDGATAGSATTEIVLPVERMRGYIVHFAGRIRAEGVSRKPNPWNGVKFMAPWVSGTGVTNWPSQELPAGTFDWQRVAFRVAVPSDARNMKLVLGLELVTGKAWFDDIQISVHRALPTLRGPVTEGPPYKGHDVARLRGAMVGPDIDADGLRVFGQEWNANVIRWQLIRRGRVADPLDLVAYDRWLHAALQDLDALLPACRKNGLFVVLDLHSPPGGRTTQGGYAGSDHGLFTNADCQQRFVELWGEIARRYRDEPAVWAYDLANEPVESVGPDDLADWQELSERAARAVRAVDPDKTIIVEPPRWGSPEGLLEFTPIDVPKVVYSVHMYLPHGFTHQNVHGPTTPKEYPGEVDGKFWDKEQLQAALQPVVDFQRAYNVHIYIGEFSAIRWAPNKSAYRYLKDLVDIFESHDWDWTYHAFREWDGWSVEHGSDRNDHQRSIAPTDRERLLRSWYARNEKPRW